MYVKRGQDAITILEPGKEYRKDDGSTGVSYNVKKVFDISQIGHAVRRKVRAFTGDTALVHVGAGKLAYLDVQARFDLYSVSNAILIAAQCPEATKLADFDTWKADGVYVKRGQDAPPTRRCACTAYRPHCTP